MKMDELESRGSRFRLDVLHVPRGTGELVLATASMASYQFALLSVGALMPFIRTALGMTPSQIGLLASAPFISAALVTFPAARLSERISAGLVVALGEALLVVASALAGFANSFDMMFAAAAAIGVGSGVLNPATNILAARLIAGRHRGLSLSVKQSGLTLGGSVAGVAMPSIALASSWRWAFLVPGALATVIAIAGVSRRSPPVGRLVVGRLAPAAVRHRLAFFGFVMAGVQVAVFAYLTVYLVDAHHRSPRTAGYALALLLAAGGVGRIAWGAFSDHQGNRSIPLLVTACGSAAALAMVAFTSGPAIWVALAVAGLCSVGWNGVYQAAVAESVGAAGVARGTAVALVFLYGGSIVVPPILGYLVANGWRTFWCAAAVGAGGAAVAMASGRRHHRFTSDPASSDERVTAPEPSPGS